MSEIAKKENTELKATDPVTFGITPISKSKINPQAVALVNEFLPELMKRQSSLIGTIHSLPYQ